MTIFSIDPGNIQSGLVKMIDNEIIKASILPNEEVMRIILNEGGKVVFEDIKPYSIRLGQQTVDTIKYIGQIQYRLNEAGIDNEAVFRWQVKKWVYDTFQKICEERILLKIQQRGLIDKYGNDRKTSFVFVDDRIVIAAMKIRWDIKTPLPGRKSLHGLSKHSWQALAVGTYYIDSKKE